MIALLFVEHSSDNRGLNATFVSTTDDAEESLLSPVGVPRVGNNPVRFSDFVRSSSDTPSDKFDGMTTQVRSRGVLVDTRGIGLEVLIDGEGDFLRTVGHQISLDLGDVLGNGVAGGQVLFVSGVSQASSGLRIAGLLAGRGGVRRQGRALNIGSGVVVVLAGGEGISPAFRVVLVVTTSD